MARHRNIRNTKSYDYDDDFDIYGQSYEDDYGVSPGTLAQYSYARNNVQFSSYMPSEDVVPEVAEEDNCFESDVPKSNHSCSSPLRPSSDTIHECVEAICDVVGESISEECIKEAAIKFNGDVSRAIDYLLNSSATQRKESSENEFDESFGSSRSNFSKKCAVNTDSIPMPQRNHSRDKRSNRKQNCNDTNFVSNRFQHTAVKKTEPTVNGVQITKVGLQTHTPVKSGFKMTPKDSQLSKSETKKSLNFSKKTAASELSTEVDGACVSKTIEVKQSSNTSLSTPKRKASIQAESTPTTPGKGSKVLVNYQEEYAKRQKEEKQQVSMVVIGHVDAGKSTMMGHLLFQKGVVSKRLIHKYEQESRKLGKSSFAYAWVLDETGEERARGVTMDIAHNRFETDKHIITLMDAPGHRDFIPNMIIGASQADVAVLVVGASTGEFEAGFGVGGQTREHAILVRSLGVAQLAVAVNKLDTADWSQKRFDEIVSKLKLFLTKHAGFKDSDVTYVPVSGLLGENLASPAKEPALTSWYKGPSLIEVIDRFRPPQRPVEFALRFCVNDVYRGQGSGISISGKVESGGVCPNTKVIVMPAGERGLVKSVESDAEEGKADFVLAGEHATLVLNGVDIMKITTGSVLCDVVAPIRAVTRLQARIIVFNIEVPITRGFPVELHYKAVSEPAIIRRILSQLHKSTGEVIAKKPKFISKGHNALIEVETTRPVCLEEYAVLKELGRFTLRYGGLTVAACIVTKLL